MKKFKILLFASLLFFVTGNAIAQQATVNDFVASWSGSGNDGNTYSMTLNADNSASLKSGVNFIDVVWWKLNFNNGNIAYDANNHTVMKLITNVMIPNPSSNQSTSLSTTGTNGSERKVYYADVYYDVASNTLTMVIDFTNPTSADGSGTKPVTITFTK